MLKLTFTLLAVVTCSLLCEGRDWADDASSSEALHVTVTGEVHAPGRYAVTEGSSISALLSQAGGVTAMAADAAYIERADENGQVKRYSINLYDPPRLDETHLLREGDRLVVPHAEEYSIIGEVQLPGNYRLNASMTVTQAIAKAGGVTIWGNRRRVEIQRKGSDGTQVIVKVKPDDFVEPGDVIRIGKSYF